MAKKTKGSDYTPPTPEEQEQQNAEHLDSLKETYAKDIKAKKLVLTDVTPNKEEL